MKQAATTPTIEQEKKLLAIVVTNKNAMLNSVDQLEKKCVDLRNELVTLSAKEKIAQAKFDELNDRVADVQLDLDLAERDLVQKKALCDAQLNEYKKKVSDEEQRLKTSLEPISAQIQDAQDKLDTLIKDYSELENNYQDLSKTKEAKSREYQVLSKDKAQLFNDILLARKELEHVQVEVATAENKKIEMVQKAEHLTKFADDLNDKVVAQKQALDEGQRKLNDLKSNIKTAELELARVEKEIDERSAVIVSLSTRETKLNEATQRIQEKAKKVGINIKLD